MRAGTVATALLAVLLVLTGPTTTGLQPDGADVPQASMGESSARLPLGIDGLPEFRSTSRLASGLTYTRISRGEVSGEDSYTVDVLLTENRGRAEEVAGMLRDDGREPTVEEVSARPEDDSDCPPLFLVRAGEFDTEAEAEELAGELEESGYGDSSEAGGSEAYATPAVVYTGEDGGETSGPWVVSVIEADPEQFGGRIVPQLATQEVPGREKLTDISSHTGSLAAINGGYFVFEAEDGTEGDLAGVSVVDGELISEAANGRSSLVLPEAEGETPRVLEVHTDLQAHAPDGARRVMDGLNRRPGLIRSCGGVGGDEPTEEPKHDFTCTDESELILFTGAFGEGAPDGEGVEGALDASGRVTEIRDQTGGEIPPEGAVLSGTGDGALWLREHAAAGETLSITEEVSADGQALPLGSVSGIINGGPRLVQGGEVEITADAEGFDWAEDPGFYYGFGTRRNPRTLAGVRPDGTLLLVTIEGSKPGYSVGASFEESAEVMRSLSAKDALNLDGGGSTTLSVGESLATYPTDDTGERPVGDAIVVPVGSEEEEEPLPRTGGDLRVLERGGLVHRVLSVFMPEETESKGDP